MRQQVNEQTQSFWRMSHLKTTNQPMFLFHLFVIIIHSFGCYLFYKGFFPVSSHKFLQEADDVNVTQPPAKYTHFILMMIDAFRSDFIYNDSKLNMPFLSDTIAKSKTFSFRARGRAPTVTMPRIKALTSGTESDFSEILSNVASSEFQVDNIVNQFKKSEYTLNFFGDDTWIKLFPKHFKRYDGTTSFVVSDYTEVDDNVTRHLGYELAANDWNVLILHYLGLDHIGHLEGPHSHLVSPKLNEMDALIKKISASIYDRSSRNPEEKFLFLICGDHGMGETGSHGGASIPEIETPFIFIDSQQQGIPFNANRFINQIDLVSTLSLLFALAIPSRNVGNPIKEFLNMYTSDEQKNFKQQLACQLYKNSQPLMSNYKKLVTELYQTCRKGDSFHLINDVTARLQDLSPKYNEMAMAFSILSIFVLAILVLYYGKLSRINQYSPYKKNYKLNTNPYMEIKYPVTKNEKELNETPKNFSSYQSNFLLKMFGNICMMLYLMSLLSSSFIEEEQYVWYFLTSSYWLALSLVNIQQVTSMKSISLFFGILLLLRISKTYNQTGVKWLTIPDISDWLVQRQQLPLLLSLICVGVLFIYFVSIYRNESKLSQYLCGVGFITILIYKLFTGSLLLALQDYYNKENNFLSYSKIYELHMHLPLIAYAIIFFSFSFNLIGFSKQKLSSWILVCLLLLKAESLPWFAVIVAVEVLVKEIIQLDDVTIGDPYYIYLLMIRFTHFAQGNSNSFSSIDISAGLIGFRDYHPVIANILTYVATYCSSVFWIFSWLDSCKNKYGFDLISSMVEFCVLEGVILMIVIYTQRFHLFIWSVFAPRLFYYFSNTLLYFLIMVIVLVKKFAFDACL